MAHDDLVLHYERMLDAAQYLDVGISWTVVQSLGEPISIDDVAALVAGPHFEIEESEVEGLGTFIDESGPSIMLLDLEGGLFSPYEPSGLERPSLGARVWHLEWNVIESQLLIASRVRRVKRPGLMEARFPLLFPTRRGRPMEHNEAYKMWKALLRQAGVWEARLP
jgi:hypothetical protein